MRRVVQHLTLFSLAVILPTSASEAAIRTAMRKADAWPESHLSPSQIKTQLQLHFAHVIRKLLANQERSLDDCVIRLEEARGADWTSVERTAVRSELSQKRLRILSLLVEYANRATFPVNDRFQTPTPIFVDGRQTHCAVGYLLARHGANDVVDAVRRTDNFLHVMDVRGGALLDWIIRSGLTLREAAMIQPAYPCGYVAIQDGAVTFQRDIEDLTAIEATSRGGYLSLRTVLIDGVGNVAITTPFTNNSFVASNSPHRVSMGVLSSEGRVNIEGTTKTAILYAESQEVATSDLRVQVVIGDQPPLSVDQLCPEPDMAPVTFLAILYGLGVHRRRRREQSVILRTMLS